MAETASGAALPKTWHAFEAKAKAHGLSASLREFHEYLRGNSSAPVDEHRFTDFYKLAKLCPREVRQNIEGMMLEKYCALPDSELYGAGRMETNAGAQIARLLMAMTEPLLLKKAEKFASPLVASDSRDRFSTELEELQESAIGDALRKAVEKKRQGEPITNPTGFIGTQQMRRLSNFSRDNLNRWKPLEDTDAAKGRPSAADRVLQKTPSPAASPDAIAHERMLKAELRAFARKGERRQARLFRSWLEEMLDGNEYIPLHTLAERAGVSPSAARAAVSTGRHRLVSEIGRDLGLPLAQIRASEDYLAKRAVAAPKKTARNAGSGPAVRESWAEEMAEPLLAGAGVSL